MKKLTLVISFLGTGFTYFIFISKTIDVCDIYCNLYYGSYHKVILFLPLVFLFSLITYFSPERVFIAWWKFARVAIPVIFLLSLAINLELHHDPQGELQGMYDVPALVLLYSIFTIGSIWQIWKGWKRA